MANKDDWAMSAPQYVNALYHLLLGREPDPAGFNATVEDLERSGDPTKTLVGLLGAPECKRRLSLIFGGNDWIHEINRTDISADGQLMEIIHQLRTDELRRTTGTTGTLVSIGCMGPAYFDWIHQNLGYPGKHIGLEYYAPKPDILPPNVVWIANTAGNMADVESASVDLIFGGQVVEHLWADELVNFFHECCRVLKIGGRLIFDTPNEKVTSRTGWKHPEHTTEFRPDDARQILESLGFAIDKLVGHWLCEGDDGPLRLNRVSDDGPYPREQRMKEGLSKPDQSFSWWVEATYRGNPDTSRTRSIVEDIWKRYAHSNFNRTISTDAELLLERDGAKYVKVEAGWAGHLVRSTHNALPPGKLVVGVEIDPFEFTTSPGILEVGAGGQSLGRRELPASFSGGVFTVEANIAETSFGADFTLNVKTEGPMTARLAMFVSGEFYPGEMWELEPPKIR